MRNKFIVLCLGLMITLVRCAAQQKIEYNIPDSLGEQQKKELKIKLNNGLNLYKLNCSACHGIFTKGKDSIPNFTTKQVSLYKAGHELRDPRNHAFAARIPPEDLDAILNFLLLRKRPDSATMATPHPN